MSKHCIMHDDGSVSIMHIVDPDTHNVSEEIAKLHPDVKRTITGHQHIGHDPEYPHEDFRDAWIWRDSALTVDMDKARAIHMDRIRAARAPVLVALDIDQMRRVAGTAHKKQALRDLPATFDLTVARTPEELAALWPDNLPKGD